MLMQEILGSWKLVRYLSAGLTIKYSKKIKQKRISRLLVFSVRWLY
jgi:hypothetical protein